jgi:hypothetical protein
MTKTPQTAPVRTSPCTNVGCRNAAPPGETLCESCEMERSLYRRDERRPAPVRTEERPRG